MEWLQFTKVRSKTFKQLLQNVTLTIGVGLCNIVTVRHGDLSRHDLRKVSRLDKASEVEPSIKPLYGQIKRFGEKFYREIY
jgi:hypothetical protein